MGMFVRNSKINKCRIIQIHRYFRTNSILDNNTRTAAYYHIFIMTNRFCFIFLVVCIVNHTTITIVIANIFWRHEHKLKFTVLHINVAPEDDIGVVVECVCYFFVFTLSIVITSRESLQLVVYNHVHFAVKPIHQCIGRVDNLTLHFVRREGANSIGTTGCLHIELSRVG